METQFPAITCWVPALAVAIGYLIIARCGRLVHILNSRLMAVMVDDDPNSRNKSRVRSGLNRRRTLKSISAEHLGSEVLAGHRPRTANDRLV
jgi:hypothetical protein